MYYQFDNLGTSDEIKCSFLSLKPGLKFKDKKTSFLTTNTTVVFFKLILHFQVNAKVLKQTRFGPMFFH